MSEETTVSQVMEQQTPDTSDTTDRNEASTEEKDFVTAEDQAPERPEWLPEKFKTPEAFAEGYSNLEKKFHQKESDLRAAWDKEIEELAYKDRPASAGDYVLPESIDAEQAPNNELLGWWSKHAWDNGLSQEEFASGIEAFKKADGEKMQSMEQAKAEEIEKLGDNAPERLQAAALFAEKFFPQDVMDAVYKITETADGVRAIEHIMQTVKTNTIATEPANRLDKETLESMMNYDRYWNPAKKDMDYIRQIKEGFEKLG